MSKFKKQYKIMTNHDREKLELKVYFEINHEGWIPLGGAIFIGPILFKEEDYGSYWAQTLWLPEEYWPEEKKADMEAPQTEIGLIPRSGKEE